MPDAIAHVTVGVASLDDALALWVDRLGLAVAARHDGADPGLATAWELAPDAIARQALLGTPGAPSGWLHLVEFAAPAPAVRDGAAPIDLGPKNLDVNCRDIAARVAELTAAGCRFRSAIAEYRVGGIHAWEAPMHGHDATNVVLIEIEGDDLALGPRHYGAVTSFVVIVPDTAVEADFYRRVLGLDEVMHHRITGAALVAAIGLPPGTALDMRLLGRDRHAHQKYGRMELIAYEGLRGADRFGRARPPATGILGCSYAVADVARFAAHCRSLGVPVREADGDGVLLGPGPVCRITSPAGLAIDVRPQPGSR